VGAVQELSVDVAGAGASRTVTVVAPGDGTRALFAISDELIGAPAALRGDAPSTWANGGPGADMVIISHKSFLDRLGPLRALRESEGLTVAVADIEDIYDEYSHGQKTPYAIRAFIEGTRTKWLRKPRYVLLVGDASFDPRNYLGTGDSDFVPTKFLDTPVMETSSDDWFVTPEGEDFADIAIGRLPVRTPDEASAVIAKIVAFKDGRGRNSDLVLYADQEGDHSMHFEANVRALAGILPQFEVATLFRREAGAETRARLLGMLNAGPLVVGYVGHGTEDLWAGKMLTSGDAAMLTNSGRPSLYLPMTCLNNAFQDVYKTGVGKALLLAPDAGAFAVLATSALGNADQQSLMNRRMLREFQGGAPTLGDAIIRAKAQGGNQVLNKTFILLGDPATRIAALQAPAPDGGVVDDGSAPGVDAQTPGKSGGGGCACTIGGTGSAGMGAAGGLLMLCVALLIARRRAR
jgi:hypothetical protein